MLRSLLPTLVRSSSFVSHASPRLGQLRNIMSSSSASPLPKTMKALQIHEQGGPEVMEIREIAVPAPKKGEILIKVEWAGINMIDRYKRSGIYKVEPGYVMGHEPSGQIVAVGEGMDAYKVGQKAGAYTAGGGFAEYCIATEKQIVPIPDSMDTRDGAKIILQGLTTLSLIKEAHEAKKGQYVLVHAAAGGVGLLLCQMLSYFGVHVIGTVSTPEKAELAKKNGAENIFIYTKDNIAEMVKEVKAYTPDGEGVHAVYDGVGADTWESDFDVVRRKGSIVTFGNASGPVPPFAPLKLAAKNLKVCRPTLNNYVATTEEMQTYAKELFDLYAKGAFKLAVSPTAPDGYTFTAEGARQSHADLSGRKTTGKLIVKIA